MSAIKIRQAQKEDAAFLAWLILTAGRAHVKRGIWEVILGSSEKDCLAFLEMVAVTQTPHLFQHTCYLVAEIDGQPVAGLGGYDPNKLGYPALQKALTEVFSQIGLNPDETNRNESPSIFWTVFQMPSKEHGLSIAWRRSQSIAEKGLSIDCLKK